MARNAHAAQPDCRPDGSAQSLMAEDSDEDPEVLAEDQVQETGLKEYMHARTKQRKLAKSTGLPDPFEGNTYRSDDDAFDGNLYRAWAFGLLGKGVHMEWGFKFFGICTIICIQVMAPAAIVFTQYFNLQFGPLFLNTPQKWEVFKPTGTWHGKVSSIMKTCLVLAFLFCFLISAIFMNRKEATQWTKSRLLWRALYHDQNGLVSHHQKIWLLIGAAMNCGLLMLLCCATYLLMYNCDGIIDVVMNIMSLVFLYRLDDLTSDFDFLGEDDWDGKVMQELADSYVLEMPVSSLCESHSRMANSMVLNQPLSSLCTPGTMTSTVQEFVEYNNAVESLDKTGTYDDHYIAAGREFLTLKDFSVLNQGTCCCYTLVHGVLIIFLFLLPLSYAFVGGISKQATAK